MPLTSQNKNIKLKELPRQVAEAGIHNHRVQTNLLLEAHTYFINIQRNKMNCVFVWMLCIDCVWDAQDPNHFFDQHDLAFKFYGSMHLIYVYTQLVFEANTKWIFTKDLLPHNIHSPPSESLKTAKGSWHDWLFNPRVNSSIWKAWEKNNPLMGTPRVSLLFHFNSCSLLSTWRKARERKIHIWSPKIWAYFTFQPKAEFLDSFLTAWKLWEQTA